MKNRGAALLLVVFILGALALLATPFMVTMILQEKSSRGFLSSVQARAAAEGSRNFAVSQLLRSHEHREATAPEAPYDNPEMDTVEEFLVPLGAPRGSSTRRGDVRLDAFFPEGITNPRGNLWGIETQDEQGKLDRRSAPDYVATRLAGLVAVGRGDPLNVFTRHAGRPAAWVAPQSIRRMEGGKIYLDERTYFNVGSRARVTDGIRYVETRVGGNDTTMNDEHGAFITVQGNTAGICPNFGWIEVEHRNPVNLNTARRETLQAIFEGLRYRQSLEEISTAEAADIAKRLLHRPIHGDADFIKFLEELQGVLTEEKVAAIYLNARAPSHLWMRYTEIVQQARPDGKMVPVEVWHDPRGTMPFTWHSENVYTVEAAGVANTPAGSLAAESRFREIVSVAPPERLRWRLHEQRDFERFLHGDLFNLYKHNDYTRGFPYGNKVVTYPARPWMSATSHPFLELPLPRENEGAPGNPTRGVRPIPAKDRRRVNGGSGWIKHFDDERSGAEGRLLSGPLEEPVRGNIALHTNGGGESEVLTFQIYDPANPNANRNLVDLRTGGVEFWFKPTGGQPFLFDIAEREYENRLACFVRGGEIILRACDATIERKAAEVRGRANLQPNTWHHVGAYWDSTKLGGLALFIDGHPVQPGAGRTGGTFAHYDDQGRAIIAELAQNLSPVDTTIAVLNAGPFPRTGVIQIGSEAIEYANFAGASFTDCVRGSRHSGPDPKTRPTEGYAHPAGAKVTIYGYPNPLANVQIPLRIGQTDIPIVLDRVWQGGATLGAAFGVLTRCQVKPADPAVPPNPPPPAIKITDVIIKILPSPPGPGDTKDFPKTGYIKIESEVILYTGKTTTSFTGCRRGQLGTTAVDHFGSPMVDLFGFPASNTAQYPSPAIIQIDDEWFAPVMAAGNYFTAPVVSGVPGSLGRGWRRTMRTAHNAGAKIIPVFAVRQPWCGSTDYNLTVPSLRDVVTILDRAGNKEEHTLRVVRNVLYNPADGRTIWGENLVGFDDFVRQEYAVDDPFARLLKFPSGELLSKVPVHFTVGGAQLGPGGGGGMMIDELRYFAAAGQSSAGTMTQPVTANADALLVQNARFPRTGGLVVVGDEVIAYRELQNNELRRCERGFLGTRPGVHDMGERVFYLGSIPTGVIAAPCSGAAPSLTLAGHPPGFAPEGYVLVDGEVIGYTWIRQDPAGMIEMQMPADRRGEGILRGCFGTAHSGHANEAILVGIPFRYWDRYKPHAADSQMVYYQAAKTALGAYWRSLRCEQEAEAGTEIVVQVRFDGRPAWDAVPANRPGGLYEFSGGSGTLDAVGDQIEVRVLFGYRRGSYHPNGAWKHAPTFLGMTVDYEQPIKALYHEER